MPKRKLSRSDQNELKRAEAEEQERDDLQEAMTFFSVLHEADSPAISAAVGAVAGAKKLCHESDDSESESERTTKNPKSGGTSDALSDLDGSDDSESESSAEKAKSGGASDSESESDLDGSESPPVAPSHTTTNKLRQISPEDAKEKNQKQAALDSSSESESDGGDEDAKLDAPLETKAYPRGKPPPAGYVCNACKQGGHWIFDCSKYTKVKKQSTKGLSPIRPVESETAAAKVNPQSDSSSISQKSKVFVQGLPFDSTQFSVKRWFEERCGPVKAVNLICFDDSKRCKGMAYVIFEGVDGMTNALALNGKPMADAATQSEEKKTTARWLSVSEAIEKPGAGSAGNGGRGKKGAGRGAAGRGSGGRGSGGGGACFRCGKKGHTPSKCTQKKMCYRCKSTEHLSSSCPNKN